MDGTLKAADWVEVPWRKDLSYCSWASWLNKWWVKQKWLVELHSTKWLSGLGVRREHEYFMVIGKGRSHGEECFRIGWNMTSEFFCLDWLQGFYTHTEKSILRSCGFSKMESYWLKVEAFSKEWILCFHSLLFIFLGFIGDFLLTKYIVFFYH